MDGKQKITLTFALYQNDALVRREAVTQDIIKVGKDAKSHLRVDDALASRMHAVIEVASPEDITLIDLGNEPGTLVNGARVNKCRIRPGDQLQIGGTRMVLERAEPVAVAAAPAPVAPSANPFGGAVANPFAGSNPFAADAGAFAFGNPFISPAQPAHDEVPADAAEGSYTYSLVKSAPEVPSEEVEDARAQTVEVMILWDTMVLNVQHLTPPRSFYVGEEQGKQLGCDYFIPSEKLGTTRAPIVLADRGGAVSLVLPRGATGTIEMAGQPKMTVAEAIEQGRTQPCAELSGAAQLPLPPGAKAKIEIGGLTFQVSTGNAGRVVAGHFQMDTQGLLYTGLSLAVHAGLLAAMAVFMPSLGATTEDGISQDQQYLLQQYLQVAAEKEQEAKTEQLAENNANDKEGGTGTRAKNEEGAMGLNTSKLTGNRYGVKGPETNTDLHLARTAALDDASKFGMIGILNSGGGGDPSAPTASWGRDESLGADPLSANGNMWGNQIGESFGAGGLGLSGIGEGGGGRGEGVGLGNIGTIGGGSGTGHGSGFGSGTGRLGGTHKAKPPLVRIGASTVSGRLPPEVIQRIVRQNFGRFRLCYENGLRSSPNLQGRVAVRFVIGHDGAVSQVSNGGSDMPDAGVVSCTVRAFYGLSFPQPEGGIVTVTYPIIFAPGG
jgi:hypothetical protein